MHESSLGLWELRQADHLSLVQSAVILPQCDPLHVPWLQPVHEVLLPLHRLEPPQDLLFRLVLMVEQVQIQTHFEAVAVVAAVERDYRSLHSCPTQPCPGMLPCPIGSCLLGWVAIQTQQMRRRLHFLVLRLLLPWRHPLA